MSQSSHSHLVRPAREEERNESVEADYLHPSSLPSPSILRSVHVLAIGLAFSDEIVKLRDYRAANPNADPPKFEDPGFRALVEENVKNTVSHVANGAIMTDVSALNFHSAVTQEISWPFMPIDDPAR